MSSVIENVGRLTRLDQPERRREILVALRAQVSRLQGEIDERKAQLSEVRHTLKWIEKHPPRNVA